jgi:hypothetical protein
MAHITKVVSVKSDPTKITDYISRVKNHPAFISALKSVDDLTGDEQEIGTQWGWTFAMGGVELVGKGETIEYTSGKVFAYKTMGEAESKFTYSVEPEDGGARLTMDVEYEMPTGVLAKLADAAVVERLNEQEADHAVENIKAILEG